MNETTSATGSVGKLLLTNPMVHLILAITLVFTLLEIFVGDGFVRALVESCRAGVYAVLATITFTAALQSVMNGARTGTEQMSISTFVLAFAILCHACWVPLVRLKVLPDWLVNIPITSALILGITFAGIGYVVPITRNRQVDLPLIGSWYGLFFSGLIAGALLTLVLVTGIPFLDK